MLPTMAGAANRCVIPEYKFDAELLTRLLVEDREKNPSKYSVVLVSEGAMISGSSEMTFRSGKKMLTDTVSLAALGSLYRIK